MADAAVHDDAPGVLAAGNSVALTYVPDGERRGEGMRVFIWGFAPKPRMIVFGAIDFAAAVARVGTFLGYHVTVCDARPIFATVSRFPDADEVVVDWPHRYLQEQADARRLGARTVIAVLTHDPKFDIPLLEVALRLPEVAYIGAMGSRRPTTIDSPASRMQASGVPNWPVCRVLSVSTLVLGHRKRRQSPSQPRSLQHVGAVVVALSHARADRYAGREHVGKNEVATVHSERPSPAIIQTAILPGRVASVGAD